MGFMGATFSGLKVNALDLSPNFAGSISGLISLFGAMTGIAAPSVAGVLTQDVSVLAFGLSWVLLWEH